MRNSLRLARFAHALLGMIVLAGCSPASLVDVPPPSTVADPSMIGNEDGALQLRSAALLGMGLPIARNYDVGLIVSTGLFTDELMEGTNARRGADERRVNDPTIALWGYTAAFYHMARIRAQVARKALQLWAPGAPRAYQGEMFALEAYNVVWLAELFCSGVPLSEVALEGSNTPTAGFTTTELYEHAVALFDSAIALGADSARFVYLARVGKARALLNLGRAAAADTTVASVPTDYRYLVQFTPSGNYTNEFSNNAVPYGVVRAQDNEGGNGLVWSTDPRTALVQVPESGEMWRPAKYNVTSTGELDPNTPQPATPFRLADGLEARLIQAEAALAAGNGSWLAILNDLRAQCIGTAACAPVPGLTTSNLPADLTDPGNASARLDLLMKERAMWLYLTGHRQGDLRRMAHVYGRGRENLWPTGVISAPAFPPLYSTPPSSNGTMYGSDVVIGADPDEIKNNKLYGGCYDFQP